MSDTCANCKFWHHWRVVACTDDEPKALGHCVVQKPMNAHVHMTIIQGLTGEDFYCDQHEPDAVVIQPQHSKQERADG